MDYKEKYEQALEVAQRFYNNSVAITKKGLEDIFPELAESEDERIRKEIIDFATKTNNGVTSILANNYNFNKWLAWLEKQGEKKPQEKSALEAAKEEKIDNANKAEPKFKAGDWVVCGQYGAPCQIESIKNGRYYFTRGIGIPVENVNIDYHLWTIQEAKDGDVLSWDGSKCIALFKNIFDKDSFNSHGFVGHLTGAFESGLRYHDIEGAHPATKEQRDTLMKAMADAGYTFDFEKKELRKIEQKPAWSEEDENLFRCAIDAVKQESKVRTDGCLDEEVGGMVIDWLKSLKDRVQPQPKQEWSEEDESRIITICTYLQDYARLSGSELRTTRINEYCDWLKSLRPQSQWKPSDLPHWKKSTLPNDNTTGFNSDYFCYKGYNINYKELFEKLPKDD